MTCGFTVVATIPEAGCAGRYRHPVTQSKDHVNCV